MSKPDPWANKISKAPEPIEPLSPGYSRPHYPAPPDLDIDYAADLSLWNETEAACFLCGHGSVPQSQIQRYDPTFRQQIDLNLTMIDRAVTAGELAPISRWGLPREFKPDVFIAWAEGKQSITTSSEWKRLVGRVRKRKGVSNLLKASSVPDLSPNAPRSESARKAANTRHGPMRQLKEFAIELATSVRKNASHKSTNQIALEIAQDVCAQGEQLKSRLSPSRSQRTIHGWLKEAEKSGDLPPSAR